MLIIILWRQNQYLVFNLSVRLQDGLRSFHESKWLSLAGAGDSNCSDIKQGFSLWYLWLMILLISCKVSELLGNLKSDSTGIDSRIEQPQATLT